MAQVLISDSYLAAIADAIREKLGVSTEYLPSEMAAAIESISTGGTAVLVSKTVTENGTYDPADDNADGYSSVTVNVSGGGGSGIYWARSSYEFDASFSTSAEVNS